ncbi:peptidase U32 family protein [Persicirhabdus sediminis]|uniref:U32 family peptidase n=1 Tax=Persicirhabdus sediminis TaxID=454144 RepID=A0A8J7MCA7_9BACT|nr:peptidase U32 family protein [Persicirhabdus sediminis]MBK1789769.1 U32 family peptidase [Persicirhabdus sediminis]
MRYENTELLAPAGCYASLQAAIENGADSVYFGLAQLNMRARARRSFHLEDLPEIVRICKEGGVKSCLTLNTLLYEHDLKLARDLLTTAHELGVSACIVSDMAAVQIANEIGFEVHISTQLSISNYESLKFYAPYSDRIVLARECNLKMIRSIWDKMIADDLRGRSGRPMELEAFAHGALCIAVSGRCGMSLYTANASANRGGCVQNCRKEYTVKDTETGKELVVDNNLIMSPNDICTIDFVDELLESGIRVFKIEGRGRSPEYVGAVIRAYRKAIDAVNDGTYSQELVEQLVPGISKVYNRGFSDGYYLGRQQGWSGTAGSKATHRKVYVGELTNFYKKAGVIEIDAEASGLAVGDEYLIIGDKTGVVEGTVESMRVQRGEEMVEAETTDRGDVITLPVSGDVRRGDKVYKMVEIPQPLKKPAPAGA